MRKRVVKARMRRPSSSLLFAEANRLWDAGEEQKAFQAFLRAATEGHVSAKNSVGYFLDLGIGTKKNAALAMAWYRRAARQGDLSACSNVAINYRNSGNARLAKAWFERAAKRGDATARLELAKLQLVTDNHVELRKAIRSLKLASGSRFIELDDRREAKALLADAMRRLASDSGRQKPSKRR